MAITLPNTASVYTTGSYTWFYNTATYRWTSISVPAQVLKVNPDLVQDQLTTSTSYFNFPAGSTSQRPSDPKPGFIRFNTDIGSLEYYDLNNIWKEISIQNI